MRKCTPFQEPPPPAAVVTLNSSNARLEMLLWHLKYWIKNLRYAATPGHIPIMKVLRCKIWDSVNVFLIWMPLLSYCPMLNNALYSCIFLEGGRGRGRGRGRGLNDSQPCHFHHMSVVQMLLYFPMSISCNLLWPFLMDRAKECLKTSIPFINLNLYSLFPLCYLTHCIKNCGVIYTTL